MSCALILSAASSRVSVAGAAQSPATCLHPPPTYVPARLLQARAVFRGLIRRERVQVVCMAHPRRVARVSSQIQREVGDLFVSDPVIQAAICPERRLGDNTLSAVASITNTYVSNDLQVVKIFVSVYSDDYGKRTAMENLQRLEPYVRRLIGQRVRLRLTPEVRFVYDDSEEEADLVARVIGREDVERYRAEIEAEMTPAPRAQQGEEGQSAAQGAQDDQAEDEEDEYGEFEDDDEDMFEDPDERPQFYPDPFGDMFKGAEGGELVQERKQGRGRPQDRQGKAGKRAGKQEARR